MRATAFITALCATAVSAANIQGSASAALASFTAGHSSLLASLENANPTSLLNSADSALMSLSKVAATATGALGSSLRAEETYLASVLSGARQTLSEAGK